MNHQDRVRRNYPAESVRTEMWSGENDCARKMSAEIPNLEAELAALED